MKLARCLKEQRSCLDAMFQTPTKGNPDSYLVPPTEIEQVEAEVAKARERQQAIGRKLAPKKIPEVYLEPAIIPKKGDPSSYLTNFDLSTGATPATTASAVPPVTKPRSAPSRIEQQLSPPPGKSVDKSALADYKPLPTDAIRNIVSGMTGDTENVKRVREQVYIDRNQSPNASNTVDRVSEFVDPRNIGASEEELTGAEVNRRLAAEEEAKTDQGSTLARLTERGLNKVDQWNPLNAPIVRGALSAVAGTAKQIGNAPDVSGIDTLSKTVTGISPLEKVRQAGRQIEAGAQEQGKRQGQVERWLGVDPESTVGQVGRGITEGIGRASVELPKLMLGGKLLGAANLPVQGALSRADEGAPGIIKGASGGLLYHYGGAATGQAASKLGPYLGMAGNSLVWIAAPAAEAHLVNGVPWSKAIGENIPIGLFAGATGVHPQRVQVREGKFGGRVRNATPEDMPKIADRTLEVVPPKNATPTVPERPEAISAQLEALKDGTRDAVLVTPGARRPPIPPGYRTVNTSEGIFIYDPKVITEKTIRAKVADGTFGRDLLGHVAEKPAEGEPAATVVARDAQGNEIQSSAVPPEVAKAQAESLAEQHPEAKIETGGNELAASVIQERLAKPAESASALPDAATSPSQPVERRSEFRPKEADWLDDITKAEQARAKMEVETDFQDPPLKRAGERVDIHGEGEVPSVVETKPQEVPVKATELSKAEASVSGVSKGLSKASESSVAEKPGALAMDKDEFNAYRAKKMAEFAGKNGNAFAKKYTAAADRLFYPPDIVEYRHAGVVTKVGDKYMLNVLADTDSSAAKWRVADQYDVTEQFSSAKAEPSTTLQESTGNALRGEAALKPESASSEQGRANIVEKVEPAANIQAAEPVSEPLPREPQTTSLKKASLAADRERLALSEFSPAERIGWERSLDTAKAKKLDGDHADRVADQILEGKKSVVDVDESAGLLLRLREVENRHQELTEQAWKETDPTRLAELRDEAKVLRDQFDKLSDASKQSKSAVARSLAFNRGAINENYSLVGMERSFKVDTGKEATGKTLAEIERLSKENSRLTTELEKAEAKTAEIQSERAVKRLQRDAENEVRRAGRKAQKENLDDEAATIKNLIAQAWMKTKGQQGIQPSLLSKLDPEGEITKLVIKLAKNRVKKGTVSAQGLVDEIHGLVKDVMDVDKRQIREMISGYGRPVKPQSALQHQMNALKTELRKGLQTEDKLGPKEGPRDRWPTRKAQLEKQIAEFERKVAEEDFSEKSKRGPTAQTAESQRLLDRREAVRNQFINLKRRNEPGHRWRNLAGMRKAWLLSGIKTHARNIVGTGLYQPFDEVSRLPAVIVDAAMAPITGQRSISGPSPVAMLDSALHAAKVGGREAGEILRRGATREDQARHQYQEINTGIKAIDVAHNAVFRFMSASDRVFYQGAYRRNLVDRARIEAKNEARNDPKVNVAKRTRELINKPTEELDASAKHDALVNTFNNNNKISDGIKRGRSAWSAETNFAVDLVMPFDRTPTNVMLRILEASPAGGWKAAMGGYKPSLKVVRSLIDKSMTREEQRQFTQTIGRATTGTALMGLGWFLAPKVLSVDDKSNVFLEVAGKKINVNQLSPIGSMFATGARLRSEYDKGTLTLGSATKIAGRTPLDQPLLRGTSLVSEFFRDPERSAGKTGASLAVSAIPFSGAIRGAGEFLDPAETRVADKSFTQQFQKNIPKWRESLPEMSDKQRKNKMVEDMRAGKVSASDLKTQRDEGKLSPSQAGYTTFDAKGKPNYHEGTIEKEAAMTPRQVAFSNVQAPQALERYGRMSEAQRNEVKALVEVKAYSLLHSTSLTDAQKAEFKKKIDELGITPRNPRRKVSGAFGSRFLQGVR